jgi:hypothetical protein
MANIKLTELSELLSVDVANTILYAADLSVSPNVSHYLRVGSISSLTDYSIANAAFVKANTAFSVGFNANSALNISNLSFAKGNVAHLQANTATVIGSSSFNAANSASSLAQLAFNRGNTAFTHANSSYNLANTTTITTTSSFNRANSALAHATAAFNYANTLIITPTTVLAQAAFNKANNAVMKAGDNITGVITSPTAANNTSNTMIATTQFVQNSISSRPSTNIGDNQTLQNMTLVRAFNTTYTNNTGKPIQVIVGCTSASGGTQTISASINGGAAVLIAYSVPNTGGFPSITGSVIVPSGATYNITRSSGSLAFWTELR